MDAKLFRGIGTDPYPGDEQAGRDQQVADQWQRLHPYNQRNCDYGTRSTRRLWRQAATKADSQQYHRILELPETDTVHLEKIYKETESGIEFR